MNGVRTIAGVFLIIGWIAVVVGGLLSLGILFGLMATMRGNFNAFAMMGALTPLFMAIAASLSPFFLWAILRALIEIHDIQTKTYEMLHSARDIEYSLLMTMQEATGIYDAFDRASARSASAPSGPGVRDAVAPQAPRPPTGLAGAAARAVASTPTAPTGNAVPCQGCGWRNAPGRTICQQCGVSL